MAGAWSSTTRSSRRSRAKRDLDRVSSFGFAAGYLGSVVLFIVNVVMLASPQKFGMSGADQAARISFFITAIWWAAFTIPLLRRVKEPRWKRAAAGGVSIWAGFRQLGETFRKLKKFKQLLSS